MPDIQVDSIGTRPNYALAYYNTPAMNYSNVYATGNPSFAGNSAQVKYIDKQEDDEQPKNNNRAGKVLRLITIVGASVLYRKAYVRDKAKGVEGFFKRIGEGSREIYNNTLKSIKNKLNLKGTEKTPPTKPPKGTGAVDDSPLAAMNDKKNAV